MCRIKSVLEPAVKWMLFLWWVRFIFFKKRGNGKHLGHMMFQFALTLKINSESILGNYNQISDHFSLFCLCIRITFLCLMMIVIFSLQTGEYPVCKCPVLYFVNYVFIARHVLLMSEVHLTLDTLRSSSSICTDDFHFQQCHFSTWANLSQFL